MAKQSHFGAGLGFLEGGGRGRLGGGPRVGGGSVEEGGWPRQVEALAVVDAEGAQEREVLVARDALGHDRGSDAFRKPDERRCERLAGRVAGDLLSETQIELHEVGSEPQDVPEVREAGTDVVDRKLGTTLAQRCKRVAQRVVVVEDRKSVV